jgi:DNA-binding response OmpR family regulator
VKLITTFISETSENLGKLVARIGAMASNRKLTIALYSDDSSVRSAVITALGRRISADLPEHNIVEFATGAALRLYLDSKHSVDLFILDGEAVPEGGLGLARSLKDELFNCPPVLAITGRVQDNWLASWSKADEVVMHPIDPFTIASKVAGLLKSTAVVTA